MRSGHLVGWIEIIVSGHSVITQVGISLAGQSIASLVEEPNGGLVLEADVGHHPQWVSHQLTQARLWVKLLPRKVIQKIILAEYAFWHLLDEVWRIVELLHRIGFCRFKMEGAVGGVENSSIDI